MDVKEIVNERLKRKYEIVLPFQKIAELEQEKLEEVRSTAHIRGFRPGKVPMSLIKKRFGDAVRSNVLDEHSKSVLDEFLKSKDEKPVDGVNVDLADREEEDSDFVLTIDYECKPHIPDVDLSSIEIEKLVADLDDDFLDQAMQEEMRDKPEYKEAPEGYAIRTGDQVALSYRASPTDDRDSQQEKKRLLVVVKPGEVDEQILFNAMKFDLVDPVVRRGLFDFFGMSGHLIGMKVGDTAEFEMDVRKSELFGLLSGKRAIFNIEIQAIEMRLDCGSEEEFARRLEYDSAAAYRLQLMARLKRHYDRLSKGLVFEALFWELTKKLEFDVPESVVDREIEFHKQELEDASPIDRENRMDEPGSSEGKSGKSGAETDSDSEAAESAVKDKIRSLAEKRVKYFMFMEELARKHEISLKSDEFLNFLYDSIDSESQRSQILEKVQNNEEFRQKVLNLAITDKTTNFALELVNAKTVKTPPGEIISTRWRQDDVNLSEGLRYELKSD